MKIAFSKKILLKMVIMVSFLAILLNPEVSVQGAQNGLLLWFQSILPILLPFLILSNLMITLDAIHYLTFFFEPIVRFLLPISSQGCFALLTGLFCGYPMGAKTTADLYEHGSIPKGEAHYLLHFCNNVSPAFTISYLCATLLKDHHLIWYLLPSIYLSPFLCAIFLKLFYSRKGVIEPISKREEKIPAFSFSMVDQAIMNGFEAVTKLGGYIILFSILSAFVSTMSIPFELKCFLLGITEFSTGCTFLGTTPFPLPIRLILVCACASFGGLSAIAQTQSMIQSDRLSIVPYIAGKFICTILSICILCVLLYLFPI